MFCYQCEQTSQGTGCNTMGVCGKTPETATLQDVMVYIVKGISQYATRAKALGKSDANIDKVTLEALFMTLTNVNFDQTEHVSYINQKLYPAIEKARSIYSEACQEKGTTPEKLTGAAEWRGVKTARELEEFGHAISILDRAKSTPADIVSLQELLTYGVKGLAAYAHHAQLLGYTDDAVYEFIYRSFDYLTTPEQTMETLLG
ncbi:MAG: hypothetical protein KA255_15115, partial [Candidatus Obscuribacter sp.]|nr:hypothetical protein [Candidatus Obscuribacter sp.]